MPELARPGEATKPVVATARVGTCRGFTAPDGVEVAAAAAVGAEKVEMDAEVGCEAPDGANVVPMTAGGTEVPAWEPDAVWPDDELEEA